MHCMAKTMTRSDLQYEYYQGKIKPAKKHVRSHSITHNTRQMQANQLLKQLKGDNSSHHKNNYQAKDHENKDTEATTNLV